MFRKSTLVLALGLAITANQAAALGLGALRTQSALNQPFYAELDLLDVRGDELDAVKARLAGPEEFAKAGAERPHFLTRLQFTPMVGPRGEALVQITSREPVREPYVDFLIEVVWPSGRLVKEFTVLLDPPSSKPGRAPTVTAPQVGAARRSPPQTPVQPLAQRPAAAAPPARLTPPAAQTPPAPARAPRPTPPAPTPAPPPVTPTPQPVPAAATATSFPLRYGPVPPGGGLWRIARRATPPGATVAQTAMAFYRNSQDAFLNGDINRLKIGGALIVPTAAELFALDADTAERQLQDAMVGRAVTSTPITDPNAQLVIADTPTAPPPTSTTPGVAPGTPGAVPAQTAPPAGVEDLTDDLIAMREVSEANRQETTDLRDRIRELEGQLADIHQLLTLRNEQLAQVQTVGGTTTTDTPPRTGEQAPPADAPGATSPPVALGPPPSDASTEAAPPTAEPGDDAGSGGLLGTLTAAMPWILGVVGGGVLLGALALLLARRRRSPDDEFEPDDLKVDLSDLDAGSAPAAPVTFTKREPAAAPSPRNVAPPPALPVATPPVVAPSDMAPTRSLAATPAPERPVAPPPPKPAAEKPPTAAAATRQAQTQEADVIAEADIYILYGRYREAEGLLREELAETPQRAELRYKLAEAYIGSNAREPLAALVAEMESRGEARIDPAKWQGITQALAELERAALAAAPPPPATRGPGQRPVPAGDGRRSAPAGQPPPDTTEVVGSATSSVEELTGMDTALDLSTTRNAPTSRGTETPRSRLDDLDLDLQDLDQIGPLSEDLSLGPLTPPPASPQAPAQLGPPATADRYPATEPDLDPGALLHSLANLDLGAQMDDLTTPLPDLRFQGLRAPPSLPDSASDSAGYREPPTLPEPTTEVVSGWGSPRPDASRSPPRALDGLTEAAIPRSDYSSGSGERDSDGGDNLSSDVLSSQWRMDSGLWDEAATKMDLARAYIEMEDPDAARAILEEVTQEGNAEQRADAQGLLAKLQ